MTNDKLKRLFLVTFIVLVPCLAKADAILPSLVLIWPITIFFFIPIVAVESAYVWRVLKLGFWETVRVVGVANLMSTVAGMPIASLAGAGLKWLLESAYFHDPAKLQSDPSFINPTHPPSAHDAMQLMFLGIYPQWIMIVSALTMMVLCFFVSWWVETWWVRRYVKDTLEPIPNCSRAMRNANLLSYCFLTGIVLWAFIAMWPSGLGSR